MDMTSPPDISRAEAPGHTPSAEKAERGPRRDHALDFTKGFMVITIAAYHLLNYFFRPGGRIYMYLDFPAGGFVFLTGLLCGTIYLRKYVRDPARVGRRLLVRALKLIVLFFALNAAICLLMDRNYNGMEFRIGTLLEHTPTILIWGSSSLTAFEILLPIAYTLIVCIFLLYAHKLKYVLLTIFILTLVVLSIMSVHTGHNLKFALIGVGGFYTGLLSPTAGAIVRKPPVKVALAVLALLYFSVAIPCGIGSNLVLYYGVVNLVLANVYNLGAWLDPSKPVTRDIVSFGRYSLLLYLAQIAILQVLQGIIKLDRSSINMGHLLLFVAVALGLAVLWRVVEACRLKVRVLDKTYRLVFG